MRVDTVLTYTPLAVKAHYHWWRTHSLTKSGCWRIPDGDVALHALTDALLARRRWENIGKLFPDTDPAFKGCRDSRELLREAWRRIPGRKG